MCPLVKLARLKRKSAAINAEAKWKIHPPKCGDYTSHWAAAIIKLKENANLMIAICEVFTFRQPRDHLAVVVKLLADSSSWILWKRFRSNMWIDWNSSWIWFKLCTGQQVDTVVNGRAHTEGNGNFFLLYLARDPIHASFDHINSPKICRKK